MEKRTIQEIAAVLIEKNALDKRAAEQFAQTLFAVISEGLERDGLVKVRGLGTFKIVEVSDRESVSVSTGERVLIQGHSKVTFTPDATMKELVNKPFSQFETVALNDGVDFEDMAAGIPQTTEAEAEPEEEAETTTITTTEPEPEPELEPEPEPEPEVKEEPEEEPEPVEPEPEAEVEEKPEAEVEEKSEAEVEEKPEEKVEAPKEVVRTIYLSRNYEEESPRRWPWVIITLLLMAASAAAGYYFGLRKNIHLPEVETAVVINTDSVFEDMTDIDTTNVDTIVAEVVPSEVKEEKPEPIQETKPEVKEEKPAPKEEKPVVKEVEDKWEKADQRLKYGAYRIVGEDYTIKVRAGETTARIAKRTLGPDMECYIEAFNSIKSNADLKEGQTVKIPKLELKKKKKK